MFSVIYIIIERQSRFGMQWENRAPKTNVGRGDDVRMPPLARKTGAELFRRHKGFLDRQFQYFYPQ